MRWARRAALGTAAVMVAAGGTVLAGAGSAQAAGWQLWRNSGNGLCMTSADDPANAFQGTATFAPCDPDDRRQWWDWPQLNGSIGIHIVNAATGKCLADVAGWGLAWMAKCDDSDADQTWRFFFTSTGDWHFRSLDDENKLSTPYAAGTSYVTARHDLADSDPRYGWRLTRL